MESWKPTRRASVSREVLPRPIRDIAQDAVKQIDRVMRALGEWGVTVAPHSRLHKAREILAYGAATGVLAPIHRGDVLGLRALELAFDYAAISDTLPPRRITAFRKDLSASLVGEIEPPETARGPLQLQSQCIVRAAFVHAGLPPEHPSRSPRYGISNPDLVLENGTERCGIEAKRPQKSANVLPRFRDGCKQVVGAGLKGGVLVDVTDCVRGLDQGAVDQEVRRLALLLNDEIHDPTLGAKPKYAHIMLAGVYARVAWSSEDTQEYSMVAVHTSSSISIFARARGTLADHRARWLRSSFNSGLSLLRAGLDVRNPTDPAIAERSEARNQ